MARQQNVDHNRYRFSVPKADTSVNQWIDAQGSLSHSIRELIKDHIRKYGITDATCMPVEQQARVGRPPKHAERDDIVQEDARNDIQEQEVPQESAQTRQEPQTATKTTVPNRMSIPIVDGTKNSLQGVRPEDSPEESMMDMTAMMAGGGQ